MGWEHASAWHWLGLTEITVLLSAPCFKKGCRELGEDSEMGAFFGGAGCCCSRLRAAQLLCQRSCWD